MKHALSLFHLPPELTTDTGEKIAPGVHAFGRAGLTLNFGLFSGSKHPYPFILTTQQPRKHSPQKAFTQHAVKQPKESQLQTDILGYKRMYTGIDATRCGGAVAGMEKVIKNGVCGLMS